MLRATFPAGTVSGAPKVRAMEIIDELEPTKRGPYAGVVGYVDFSGNLDTAIAIRTMLWRNGRASVQAGAGIVADSIAADEDLECHNKARALLTAAAAARALTPLGTAGGRDMSDPVAELERLRNADESRPAVVDRSDRGFVHVSGPDAFSFLQVLVSADLDAVADGEGVESLLLQPQGKLDVAFRLLRRGDEAVARHRPRPRGAARRVARALQDPGRRAARRPQRRLGDAHRSSACTPHPARAVRCTSWRPSSAST